MSPEPQRSEGSAGSWRDAVLEVQPAPGSVQRAYSRLAPVYEVWARAMEGRPRRRVLELANIRDGESVLEVATGPGTQLVEVARRNPGGRTVGIELSPGMLKQARRRLARVRERLGPRVELVAGDARSLPFGDASFDLLINEYMLDLLSHDDIVRALREFRRVLKPGGRIVLSNMTKAERFPHGIWEALHKRGINVTAHCRGVLAAPALEELGFADIGREYMGQMLFPTEIVTAHRP